MFEADLKQLGLSDKEAKVYLAVLELGPASVVQISQSSGINRPTTYVQIQSLTKLGLMSSYTKGKKQFFAAEPPERLKELVRAREQEVNEQRGRLGEILPQLQIIFDTAEERPKVRFYEGKEGIRSMAADIFSRKTKEIFTISSAELFKEIFTQEEHVEFEQLRRKYKIKVKHLYNSKKGALSSSRSSTVEDRFIPFEKFPITSGIDIYQNKISAFTLKGKLIGVIIESSEISDTMRSLFNLAWEAAEKYK